METPETYHDIDISQVMQIKSAKLVVMADPPAYKGKLKEFQKQGVAFMYFAKRCGLFDCTGAGKTHEIMGLLAILKKRGELGRCLYLVNAADILSKGEELRQFTTFNFGLATGTLAERLNLYSTWCDILFVSYEMARGRDFEYLRQLEFDTIICDESHIFRNKDTRTATVVQALTRGAERVISSTATPIQMNLLDMYTQINVWHHGLFPSFYGFKKRYCVEEDTVEWHGLKRFQRKKIVAYRNMEEFKKILEPFYIRRSVADIEDELPELMPEVKWGALTPQQDSVYQELRKGVVRLIHAGNISEARRNMHTLQKCVDSTAALVDEGTVMPDYSWKFDWLLSELRRDVMFGGSMANEKVVVYIQHKSTIATLRRRLDSAGIRYVIMTGDESKEIREHYRQQFWVDPQLQLIVGTSAIEASLNLQVARYMVAVDSISNPARMTQLVGRVRRVGSKHHSVVFVRLITRNTFEERYARMLERRQALSDYVFSESNDLFDKLSSAELEQLIS